MTEQEYMPIHPNYRNKEGIPQKIPMGLLSEKQANINHQQDLTTLARRGGLSPREALAIIRQLYFHQLKDLTENDVVMHLNDHINRYNTTEKGEQK